MLSPYLRLLVENAGFAQSGKLSPGELCAKPAFSITARYEYKSIRTISAALLNYRMPQRAWRSDEMKKSDTRRHLDTTLRIPP